MGKGELRQVKQVETYFKSILGLECVRCHADLQAYFKSLLSLAAITSFCKTWPGHIYQDQSQLAREVMNRDMLGINLQPA